MHEGKNMGIMTTLKPTAESGGGEAGLPESASSPARPAGARVPYPFPWQRLARLHACAPVSAAAPP